MFGVMRRAAWNSANLPRQRVRTRQRHSADERRGCCSPVHGHQVEIEALIRRHVGAVLRTAPRRRQKHSVRLCAAGV